VELLVTVGEALVTLLAAPSLPGEALMLAHALARSGALPPAHASAVIAPMRRALVSLGSLKDVQALCSAVGLESGGSRAVLHARVLGMREDEFRRLGEEASTESDAEHELFWLS
jgi:3-oxoacyl-ACP reductase-like protein